MTEVEALCAQWLQAKKEEDAAIAKRRNISNSLANLLPVPEGQQSKTHTVGDYKVGVKPATNYKIDWPALDRVYAEYSAKVCDDARIALPEKEPKRQLDEKGLRWIRENAKDLYLAISQAITATPGTTGITVEPITKEETNV